MLYPVQVFDMNVTESEEVENSIYYDTRKQENINKQSQLEDFYKKEPLKRQAETNIQDLEKEMQAQRYKIMSYEKWNESQIQEYK